MRRPESGSITRECTRQRMSLAACWYTADHDGYELLETMGDLPPEGSYLGSDSASFFSVVLSGATGSSSVTLTGEGIAGEGRWLADLLCDWFAALNVHPFKVSFTSHLPILTPCFTSSHRTSSRQALPAPYGLYQLHPRRKSPHGCRDTKHAMYVQGSPVHFTPSSSRPVSRTSSHLTSSRASSSRPSFSL
jgi:hypothetical protein